MIWGATTGDGTVSTDAVIWQFRPAIITSASKLTSLSSYRVAWGPTQTQTHTNLLEGLEDNEFHSNAELLWLIRCLTIHQLIAAAPLTYNEQERLSYGFPFMSYIVFWVIYLLFCHICSKASANSTLLISSESWNFRNPFPPWPVKQTC